MEHHTQLLVDVVDRLVIAGLAIDTLFSMVGSMSSTIGDVRSLTEHSTFSTLVDAVAAAVDVLANTPEVSALDSRLVVLDRVLGELDVDVNERIEGAFNLLVQRLVVTVQGLARRVLQLEDDATYDDRTLGTESLPTHAGILHGMVGGTGASAAYSGARVTLQLSTPVMDGGVQVTTLGEILNAQGSMEKRILELETSIAAQGGVNFAGNSFV